MRWLRNGWIQDLRQAVRALRRSPGFTLVAVGTLGLALGVNAGIFSIVDAVLLRPLPFPEPDRLVYIGGTAPGSDLRTSSTCRLSSSSSTRTSPSCSRASRPTSDFTNTLRVGDRAERVRMAVLHPSLFPTLGAAPILGRVPVPEDEDRVAVLSHGLWTSWFGGDTAVIGRSYYIGGKDRTVIGVMGPEFRFPVDGVTLWITDVIRPEDIEPGRFGMALVGRMRPGVTFPRWSGSSAQLAQRLPERFGGSPGYAELIRKHRPVVRPLEEQLVGQVAGRSGSCSGRWPSCCSSPAPTWAISSWSARSGGSGSWPSAARSAPRAAAALPRPDHRGHGRRAARGRRRDGARLGQRPPVSAVRRRPTCRASATSSVRWTTLLFTGVASALAALLCGALPALRASEPSLDRLRDGSRGSTSRRHWARDGLVVAQTALALVLLTGSALLFRSFQKMGTWIRATTPGTSSPSRSRPRAITSTTRPRSPGSISPSRSGSQRCPASRRWGSWTTSRSTKGSPSAVLAGRAGGREATGAFGWASTPSRATTSRPRGSGCSRAGCSPRRSS